MRRWAAGRAAGREGSRPGVRPTRQGRGSTEGPRPWPHWLTGCYSCSSHPLTVLVTIWDDDPEAFAPSERITGLGQVLTFSESVSSVVMTTFLYDPAKAWTH